MAAATNSPGVRASIVLSSAMPTVAVTEPPTMKRFQRPVAETSLPTTSEETARPATIGMVRNPEAVGFRPRLIWKYWLRKMVAPNRATPMPNPAPVASATVRWRNSSSGITGSAARSSTTTASASSPTPPTTNAAEAPESQANCWPARDTQTSRALTPPVSTVAPR